MPGVSEPPQRLRRHASGLPIARLPTGMRHRDDPSASGSRQVDQRVRKAADLQSTMASAVARPTIGRFPNEPQASADLLHEGRSQFRATLRIPLKRFRELGARVRVERETNSCHVCAVWPLALPQTKRSASRDPGRSLACDVRLLPPRRHPLPSRWPLQGGREAAWQVQPVRVRAAATRHSGCFERLFSLVTPRRRDIGGDLRRAARTRQPPMVC